MTIAQVSNLYSGSSSGAWGNNVASWLGVTPDTPFAAVATSTAGSSILPTIPVATDDGNDLLAGLIPSDSSPYLVAGGIAAMVALALAFS
jgi:hypothetical protein